MTDHELDDAIDRAVREMTRVEPPDGMKARVLARVAEPRAAGLPLWRIAGVTAAIALVLVTIVYRATRAPEPALTAPVADVTLPPNVVPPVETPLEAVRERPAPRAAAGSDPRVVASRVPERRVLPAVDLEPRENAIRVEPLSAIRPIEIAQLEEDPIRVGDVDIPPLRFERIEVTPLSEPR